MFYKFIFILAITESCYWKKNELKWWGDENWYQAFHLLEKETHFKFSRDESADILVPNVTSLPLMLREIERVILGTRDEKEKIRKPFHEIVDAIVDRYRDVYVYGKPCTVRYDTVAVLPNSTLLVVKGDFMKTYDGNSVTFGRSVGYPLRLANDEIAWIQHHLLKLPDGRWIDLQDAYRDDIKIGVSYDGITYLFGKNGGVYVNNTVKLSFLVFNLQTPEPIKGSYTLKEFLVLVADDREWFYDAVGRFLGSRRLSDAYPTVFCKDVCDDDTGNETFLLPNDATMFRLSLFLIGIYLSISW